PALLGVQQQGGEDADLHDAGGDVALAGVVGVRGAGAVVDDRDRDVAGGTAERLVQRGGERLVGRNGRGRGGCRALRTRAGARGLDGRRLRAGRVGGDDGRAGWLDTGGPDRSAGTHGRRGRAKDEECEEYHDDRAERPV